MKYVHSKDLAKMIAQLRSRGGIFQKAAEKTAAIIGRINMKDEDPLSGIALTNHGESRIKHCLKYDLSGFCRLVTIQNNGYCFLAFVGDHDDCDRWIEKNKGFEIAFDKNANTFEPVFNSIDIHVPEKRVTDNPDYTQNNLLQRLGDHYFDRISTWIPYSIIRRLEGFDGLVDEDEILDVASLITDKDVQYLVFDVFIQLKGGRIDEAKNRILLFENEIKLLEEATQEELRSVQSNDYFRETASLNDEDIQILMKGKGWLDWMLFMHPDQHKLVTASFSGPARLLGVSGSGKTAVVVRRAIHLAIKYPGEKILVLTLNRALSSLIQNLVEAYIAPLSNKEAFREQITISSYWEVCINLLMALESDPLKRKGLSDFSHKHNDNIEDLWAEFYRCDNNNHDALVLFPIHKNLLMRSIYPQVYIKQEFDWVRSALAGNERERYIELEREGRAIPLNPDNRNQIISGLESWENFMNAVGASDYLSLTQKLIPYINKITPSFRSILVDEIQDFGTLELSIIRRLVADGSDDLFLCGDISQQVYAKHHKLTQASIKISPNNYLTIKKNYRNSREILSAAYQVLKTNTTDSEYEYDDFKVLDPEYANFSSPRPFLRASSSLNNEFNFAITYLRDILEASSKGCIAICGYSYYQLHDIAKTLGLPVLDGKNDLTGYSIFLSDLEQTKGFEFDRMIIINCSNGVIPNREFPKEEWYRDISKLYVAMTRAKYELVISYSNELSPIFKSCQQYFTTDKWVDHLRIEKISTYKLQAPGMMSLHEVNEPMTGAEFLYTKQAIGFSNELQEKLLELVDGKDLTDEKGNRLKWRAMNELVADLNSGRTTPNLAQRFGRVVVKELKDKLGEEIKIIVR